MTGSGKTVNAAAVIEAMVHGSADLAVDPDPRAAFLWVTDDPALNRQTRKRMIEASDMLHPNYAEQYGAEFLRIESVAKFGEQLRTLDLQDSKVRGAIHAFDGGKVTTLYESDAARDYA